MYLCVIKCDVLKISHKIYQILRRVIDENIFFCRTEYWKSTGKKFCDFCKCWIADNKPVSTYIIIPFAIIM